MTHDDEREHIARMAAMLDVAAMSRPHLPHPTPQYVALRIMDALRDAGLASWAAMDAVRAGCARAAAEHAAAPQPAETLAWAVVGEDGTLIETSINRSRAEAEGELKWGGARIVRVAIRRVEGEA